MRTLGEMFWADYFLHRTFHRRAKRTDEILGFHNLEIAGQRGPVKKKKTRFLGRRRRIHIELGGWDC